MLLESSAGSVEHDIEGSGLSPHYLGHPGLPHSCGPRVQRGEKETTRPGELWVQQPLEDHSPDKIISKSKYYKVPSQSSMQCQCFKSQALNSELTCEDTFPPGEGAGSPVSPCRGSTGAEASFSPDSRQSLWQLVHHTVRVVQDRGHHRNKNKAPTMSRDSGLAERPLTPGFPLWRAA